MGASDEVSAAAMRKPHTQPNKIKLVTILGIRANAKAFALLYYANLI